MSDTISFLDSASNEGTITQGTFSDTTVNLGTVEVASFAGTASNEGAVVSASFSDGAVNIGTLTSGTFLGTAINSGVVQVAEFFGTASNVGVIVEAAKFADTSSNVGTVSGSAIFADTSVSNGVVEGTVQLGVNVTEGENQALTETPTEYSQPDGFFPNAHYSGGSKAAPANYATVVHQVGSFWYKYDASGDGTLASGNYSDGTSLFTFTNGVKGAAYTPGSNVLGSYYYAGSLTSGTTILYSDEALTTIADNITYIDAGVAKYTTNGSGVVTEEFITLIAAGGYYYVGTFTSGTTVLYTSDALTTTANSITPFVYTSYYYTTNGSGVVTEEFINTTGSYYHIGAFAVAATLYTNNNLTTLATSLTDSNVGDIDSDGFDDFVSTDSNGVITAITYGTE